MKTCNVDVDCASNMTVSYATFWYKKCVNPCKRVDGMAQAKSRIHNSLEAELVNLCST